MTGNVRTVYRGKVLKLNIEQVELPNGTVAELEIAHHPGGAVVVAVDDEDCICLLRQFRHAAGGWITELPAGKIDNREPPLECAMRELAEEAGVEARRWDSLGQFFSSPGVFTEVIHVFLARGLAPCEACPEQHEVLRDALGPAGRGLFPGRGRPAAGRQVDHRPGLGPGPPAGREASRTSASSRNVTKLSFHAAWIL